MKTALAKIQARHDDVAHERQQKLAVILLLSNVGIAVSAVALSARYGWNPGLSVDAIVTLSVLIVISWLALLIAAGAFGWLAELPSAFSAAPDPRPQPVDAAFLAKYRMFFFYAGVVVNLAAFAYVTEVTGGLSESPFVPLFVAFVLTGPQLSRFRTQSLNLLLAGITAAVIMVLVEPLVGKPNATAPHELIIAAVLFAVIFGGLLNYFEKPNNHNVSKHIRPPSRARIYRDGLGNWRFALYHSVHQQDPILVDAAGAAVPDGEFPALLKERFEAYLLTMRSTDWGTPTLSWPERCRASFAMALVYTQEIEE